MSRRAQENLIVLLLISFFIGIIVISYGYGPRARLVPLPISYLGIGLLLVQLVWQNIRPADELNVDLLEFLTNQKIDTSTSDDSRAQSSKSSDTESVEAAGIWASETVRILFAIGKVAFLVIMFLTLGAFPSIFIFTAGYFIFSRHYSKGKGLFFSAVFTGVVYLVFVVGLQLQLYHGVLEPLIEQYRNL